MYTNSSVGKESACNVGGPGSIPGSGRFPGEGRGYPLQCSWASPVAQLVKNLPAVRKTWIRFLGWEDSPGEGKGYPLQYPGMENSMNSPWGHKEWDTTERLLHTHCIHTRFYNCHLIFWWFSEEVKHNRTLHPKHLNTHNIKCGPDSILGARGQEHSCQCRRLKGCRFDPWVGKIPWKRAWQPTLVFLPGESHGQRSLVGYHSWSLKESDMTEVT